MTMQNPWRKLGSRTVYENPWLSLREDRVIRPNGEEGIYSVIDTRIATAVCALTPDRNIHLVGQYRYPLKRYTWEIPEGGGDRNVDPLISAQRELKEETGIEARSWRKLLEMDLSNSITDEVATVFLATGLSHGEAEPEETEALTLRRLPFDEAYAMVRDGRIADVMSVAALLKVHLMRIEGEL